MTRGQRSVRLLGEFLRELAVSVVVFVPLEAAAHETLTWRTVLFTVVVSGATLGFGVWLEVSRR